MSARSREQLRCNVLDKANPSRDYALLILLDKADRLDDVDHHHGPGGVMERAEQCALIPDHGSRNGSRHKKPSRRNTSRPLCSDFVASATALYRKSCRRRGVIKSARRSLASHRDWIGWLCDA